MITVLENRRAQKYQPKDRKCDHCDMTFETTAKGIKEHAEKCIQNPKNKGKK